MPKKLKLPPKNKDISLNPSICSSIRSKRESDTTIVVVVIAFWVWHRKKVCKSSKVIYYLVQLQCHKLKTMTVWQFLILSKLKLQSPFIRDRKMNSSHLPPKTRLTSWVTQSEAWFLVGKGLEINIQPDHSFCYVSWGSRKVR